MVLIERNEFLLTPDQVAAALNLSRRRVVTRTLRRELPWLKLGPRTLRLPAGALSAYLETAKRNGQAAPHRPVTAGDDKREANHREPLKRDSPANFALAANGVKWHPI